MLFSPTVDNCNRSYKQDIYSRICIVRHFFQLLYMKHLLWHWHIFSGQYVCDQRKPQISVMDIAALKQY